MGFANPDKRRQYQAQWKRKKREKRAAAGLCWECDEVADHGRRCFRHWLMHKEANRKAMRKVRKERKERGVCPDCGGPLDGRTHCGKCSSSEVQRDQYRALGLKGKSHGT